LDPDLDIDYPKNLTILPQGLPYVQASTLHC